MEKDILNLFSEDILQKSISFWGGNKFNLKLLGELENFVYEFNDHHKNFILRITHSSHRSKELVEAELDWINFLAANELPVCKPVLSLNNTFIETIPANDGYFIVSSFEKARGQAINKNPGIIREKEFNFNLGKLVGKLHHLTKSYTAKLNKRQQWFEEDNVSNAEIYLPLNQIKIIEEIKTLKLFFSNLPRNKDNYGLIHTDIHGGNFFIDQQEIILFDFDDSCYHWYIYDIAVVIYSFLLKIKNEDEKKHFGREFTRNFLKGYAVENTLEEEWLGYMPEIFRFRELLIYVFLNKKWDLNNLNKNDKEFFNNLKNRIDNNIPLVNCQYILS
jgi:Ser/Thr protein kinase RdoA (MazF antagonist)